jgi:hypothetical protein
MIYDLHRKKWLSLCALMVATAGATAAWPQIEPILPAHRQYVRDGDSATAKAINTLAEKFEDARRDTQIDTAKKSIVDMRAKKAQWVELYNRADSSATTKTLAEQQITVIDNTIVELTDQIRSLQRLKK